MNRYIFVYILYIGLALTTLEAQTFTAKATPSTVGLGQRFKVTFTVSGATQVGRPNIPSFDNFVALGGPSQSQNVAFSNGQMSSSIGWTYVLQPKKKGTFTIKSATIKVADKTLKTDPLTIEVVDAPQKPQSNNRNVNPYANQTPDQQPTDVKELVKENVFAKAFVNKSNVYQGEQLTVIYKIYIRAAEFSSLELEEAPKYEGFWAEDISIDQLNYTPETYDGKQYYSAIVKKAILFPQKSGELTVPSLKLKSEVYVKVQSNNRPRNPFDLFFSRPQYATAEYSFASASHKINVKPLPTTGKPANFSGAVGSFSFETSFDKTETETTDPVTMTIKVKGKGNLKTLTLPEPFFPPDFEVYDPKTSDKYSASSGSVQGSKSADYLVVPMNPGEYKVEPLTFSYFDPSKGRYQTLNSPDYTLTITGDPQQGSTIASTGTQKEDVKLLGEDIRFIKSDLSSVRKKGEGFFGSPSFFLLYLSPLFLFFGLLWRKRKKDEEAKDVVGMKKRKATQMAQKRLATAQGHMQNGKEKEFYDEVIRAIWGYLSDKLTIGQAELSRDNIRELLTQKGIQPTTLKRLTDLLDTCEIALFAPTMVSGGMDATYNESLQFISDLEDEIVQSEKGESKS